MNQGNNQNFNNSLGNGVTNTVPVNSVPSQPVQPTQVVQPVQTPVTPMPQQVQPVQPTQVVTPNQVVQPVQTPVNTQQSVVAPTQNVIMTGKKKSSAAFIFIAAVIVGAFIYFIDDILSYFNQNFSPVTENAEVESASSNLVNGMIKIGDQSSYIKLKFIRFYNVKKSTNNQIFISYISDKNYNNSNDLNIDLQLFDSNKEKIYEEKFSITGSIESNTTRQYKLIVDETVYNNSTYVLIKSN